MNCKQGDKAMVVHIPPDTFPFERRIITALLGRVVICAQLKTFDNRPTWYFDRAEEIPHPTRPWDVVCVDGLWDCCLMPLRDAGDDEVAEELRRIRTPESTPA